MTSDDISLYLPKYLSPETNDKLFQDLKSYEKVTEYYAFNHPEGDQIILQGDGISGLPSPYWEDGVLKSKNANVLILSNTCDIDTANHRDLDMNIMYAPIVVLEKYRQLLLAHGVVKDVVDSKIATIREQKVSNIFYLPSGWGGDESIVLLDHISNYPNTRIDRSNLSTNRLFTLNQTGFYILLYKLSVHFTRMCEHIDRNVDKMPTTL